MKLRVSGVHGLIVGVDVEQQWRQLHFPVVVQFSVTATGSFSHDSAT